MQTFSLREKIISIQLQVELFAKYYRILFFNNIVHERDVKRARYVVQRIEVYFNYIGRFENELTKQI
ncbi:hypothetical protein RGT18_16260 [Solobacterium moorei]|nr:hypothetical protein RGT18_16260 [Solobacterium moorei]